MQCALVSCWSPEKSKEEKGEKIWGKWGQGKYNQYDNKCNYRSSGPDKVTLTHSFQCLPAKQNNKPQNSSMIAVIGSLEEGKLFGAPRFKEPHNSRAFCNLHTLEGGNPRAVFHPSFLPVMKI